MSSMTETVVDRPRLSLQPVRQQLPSLDKIDGTVLSSVASAKRHRRDDDPLDKERPSKARKLPWLSFVPDDLAQATNMVTVYRGLPSHLLAANAHNVMMIGARLESLFQHHSALGNQESALVALQQCVALYRDLAYNKDALLKGTNQKNFEHVLSELYDYLSRIGRDEDALEVVEECVALARALIEDGDPNSDLPRYLREFSTHLSQVGRHDDALAATRECIAICRDLIKVNPSSHNTRQLAKGLDVLHTHISRFGRAEEALAMAQESAALYRNLAGTSVTSLAKPDPLDDVTAMGVEPTDFQQETEAYNKSVDQRELAKLLDITFSLASGLDRAEDAFVALVECAAVYRDLIKRKRATWWNEQNVEDAMNDKLNLGDVLKDLHAQLSGRGRQEDALAVTMERVALYRALDDAEGDFGDKRRETLGALCVELFELGHQEEALAIASERVSLRLDYFRPYLNGLAEADRTFDLVVAALLSTPTRPTYPGLRRYLGMLPLVSRKSVLTTASDCLMPKLLTLHDEGAHPDLHAVSECNTKCYRIASELIPRLYDQGDCIVDQLDLLCHLRHHVDDEYLQVLHADLEDYFMVFHRTNGHQYISLGSSVYSRPHSQAIPDLLVLLQSCLTRCSTEHGHLWTHQRQKILLLRLLQDACSVTRMLPSIYQAQGVVIKQEHIASGGESSVYRGTLMSAPVAIRKPHSPYDGWDSEAGQEVLKSTRREIISHWQLNHQNVLKLVGILHEGKEDVPSMIVPLMENGPASKYLKKVGYGDGTPFLTVIHGAAQGLDYLHSQQPPVIHADLHDGNIVIDGSGQALLCDFGLSRIRHEVTRTFTFIRSGGRELFVAPELSADDDPRPDEAGDVYTFAMTILKLGTGANPFSGEFKNERVALREAQQGRRPRRPATFGGLPNASFDTLWSLMEKMWAHNPAERPAACEVVEVTRKLVAAHSAAQCTTD